MNRIVIVGSGGSGKSTLARQVGLALCLEVTHLDGLFWKPGWVRISAADQEGAVSEIISRAKWIIDGDHLRTQPARFGAADTILFLDFPRGICLWRTVKRFFQYQGRSRVGMALGCRERLNLTLLRWVWRYPLDNRAQVLGNITRYGKDCRVVTLRSPKAVRQFLDALPSQAK